MQSSDRFEEKYEKWCERGIFIPFFKVTVLTTIFLIICSLCILWSSGDFRGVFVKILWTIIVLYSISFLLFAFVANFVVNKKEMVIKEMKRKWALEQLEKLQKGPKEN